MRFKMVAVYLAVLGIVTSLFGVSDIILAVIGRDISTEFLAVSESMWSFWKGLILFFAGVFIFVGAMDLEDIHGLGKAVLGSIMLWILAGCNIFARITQSIPGEEGWFSTLEDFLATYGPPYQPELWLLPFSLVVLYLVARFKR